MRENSFLLVWAKYKMTENAEWLLAELYRRTGLRTSRWRRDQGGRHVYLISEDLRNPAILELEEAVKASASAAQCKRLYAEPKNRTRSLASLIWALNGVKPEIRDCVVDNKHQTKYVLGPLKLESSFSALGHARWAECRPRVSVDDVVMAETARVALQ